MKEEHESVFMLDNYGPFKAGREYQVFGTGRDYVRLRAGGHVYCVPVDLTSWGESWAVGATTRRLKSRSRNRR